MVIGKEDAVPIFQKTWSLLYMCKVCALDSDRPLRVQRFFVAMK